MKLWLKRILSLVLALTLVMAWLPTGAFAADAEINAATYYYDHLSERQQWCYDWLKTYYDTGDLGEAEWHIKCYNKIVFKDLLPEGSTEEDVYALGQDFATADYALTRDHPYYELFVRLSGWSSNIPDSQDFVIEFEFTELYTDDAQQRIDARIRQIVETVGDGDRYTKLRKLTDYLLTTTFYDPYLDIINASGSWLFDNRGTVYDGSAYGILMADIAICEGYAATVKLLCDALDIPCLHISNYIHAWNVVQMEDGQWYRLDLTNAGKLGWDDTIDLDGYFENVFLNPNVWSVFDHYRDPDISPELCDTRYEYTGTTTDFSYTVAENTYQPSGSCFRYTVNMDHATCTIVNYEGTASGDLVIPETIDGYTVTAIGGYAFYYCTGITGTLVIPDTVQIIGKAAFAGCYNMTAVELPENLQVLGTGAFIGCKALTSVAIPDLVGTVGDYAFYDCNRLTEVSVGTHIQTVGTRAFAQISDGAVITGPADSAIASYAEESGISFRAEGTLCALTDADGQWEYDEDYHHHTCEHGAWFDLGAHTEGFYVWDETCAVCDEDLYVLRDQYESNHIWDEGAVTQEATCIMGGMMLYTCVICGEQKDEHIWSGDHKWVTTNCGEHQICAYCGATGEIADHDYTATVTAPTCTEQGYTTYTCKICGDSYTDNYVSATGHIYGEWETVTEPTCMADGLEQHTCINCGHSETNVLNTVDHSYTTKVTAPTCTEQGYNTYTCTVCGDSYVDAHTDALGHDYDEDGHCTRCDDWQIVYEGTGEVSVSVDEDLETLTEILVDGEAVDPDCYTVSEDGATVTFTEEFLGSLSVGQHTVSFSFANGMASATLTVEQAYILGDINNDGEIDIFDANAAAAYANELRDLDDTQLLAGDVNGDGEVDIFDANLIAAYANELLAKFPAEP